MGERIETTITVKLLATLRSVAGAKQIEIPTPEPATVRDVLNRIKQVNPALGGYILDAEGQLKPGIQLVVGGQHIEWQQGLDTPLHAGDDLLFIPPIAGG